LLISGEALDHEGVPVQIIDSKFSIVSFVALVPTNLNDTSDREWLREWPYLCPSTAQEEEETFADFRTIRQNNFRPHVRPVATSGAMELT